MSSSHVHTVTWLDCCAGTVLSYGNGSEILWSEQWVKAVIINSWRLRGPPSLKAYSKKNKIKKNCCGHHPTEGISLAWNKLRSASVNIPPVISQLSEKFREGNFILIFNCTSFETFLRCQWKIKHAMIHYADVFTIWNHFWWVRTHGGGGKIQSWIFPHNHDENKKKYCNRQYVRFNTQALYTAVKPPDNQFHRAAGQT